MLELEFTNTTDISNNISNKVNDTDVYPLLSNRDGNVRAYFNLSPLLTDDVRSISFTIDSDNEDLVAVRLLEVSTAQKPAVSEVRYTIEITE